MRRIVRGFTLVADDVNKFLEIEKMALPNLEEEGQVFTPGGADIGVKVNTHMMPLECPFGLKSYDVQTMGLFGLGYGERKRYTAYGYLVSEIDGTKSSYEITMWGRLGKMARPEMSKGDLAGLDHTIEGISLYEERVDGEEVYFFDAFNVVKRIRGVDVLQKMRESLRIA